MAARCIFAIRISTSVRWTVRTAGYSVAIRTQCIGTSSVRIMRTRVWAHSPCPCLWIRVKPERRCSHAAGGPTATSPILVHPLQTTAFLPMTTCQSRQNVIYMYLYRCSDMYWDKARVTYKYTYTYKKNIYNTI
jgi:hypothetical protein